MQIDNRGVQERKIAKIVREKILPIADKLVLTSKDIPPGLMKLEMSAKPKVDWPRSIYVYLRMLAQCDAYRYIPDKPYEQPIDNYISLWRTPWTPSTTHGLDLTLDRNKRALHKAAGLPKLGRTKEQELAFALQYVENVVKVERSLSTMPSIMPGHRTQQSHPDEPKVRLIWMITIDEWILECEALDSGITQIIASNKSKNLSVKLFYCTPQSVHEWFRNWNSQVVCWVNGDAEQFDSTVRASELAAIWQWCAPKYEFTDLVARYTIYASLVLPEGDLIRSGGMPSGSKITNLGDGMANFIDWLEALERTGFLRYLICVFVNGDDISLGFTRAITLEELTTICVGC
jgi:hypothetical protein